MKMVAIAVVACGLLLGGLVHAADLSIAQQLAVVDANRADVDGLEVQRAQAALDGTREICAGDLPEKMVADVAITVARSLTERGIFSRPIDVLEDVNAIYIDPPGPLDCAKLMEQYMAFRKPDISHVSTAASMRAIVVVARQLQKKAQQSDGK